MPDMLGLKDIGIIILNKNEYGRTNPIIRHDENDRRLELRLPHESGAVHRPDRERLAAHQDASPVYKEKTELLQSIVNRQLGFVATADMKKQIANATMLPELSAL